MNGLVEHGNGFAKYRLAKYFLNGKGRAVDAGSAARLFAEAAQASDVYVRRFVTPWAKYQLGKLRTSGETVFPGLGESGRSCCEARHRTEMNSHSVCSGVSSGTGSV